MTTFDMISITISIIGLLGGFSSWFYMWLKSRLNIRIRILSKLIKSRTNFILLYMSFSNESTLPVLLVFPSIDFFVFLCCLWFRKWARLVILV